MRQRSMTFPEIALISATRGLAGLGLGLLLADQIDNRRRKTLGASLLAVGALTTVPILIHLLRKPVLGSLPEAPARQSTQTLVPSGL